MTDVNVQRTQIHNLSKKYYVYFFKIVVYAYTPVL